MCSEERCHHLVERVGRLSIELVEGEVGGAAALRVDLTAAVAAQVTAAIDAVGCGIHAVTPQKVMVRSSYSCSSTCSCAASIPNHPLQDLHLLLLLKLHHRM
jgi:hypothetical protein